VDTQKKPKKKYDRLNKTQQKMVEAMQAACGNVTLANQMTGISRQNHYNWLKINSKYKEAIDGVCDKNVDIAESKLLINVKDGKESSIKFLLERQGQHRGYGRTVEKADIDLKSGDELTRLDNITQALASGKISFQLADRLMKSIQLKVDLKDQIEVQDRLKRIEEMLDGQDKS